MALFLGSLLCTIYLGVFLCQYHTNLITIHFVIYFEIREGDDSSFVLFSQDCFGYSGSFVVSQKFYDYLFLQKMK